VDTTVTPPEPRRSLAVVPLIADKRYYGETPARLPGVSGGGWEEQGASRPGGLGRQAGSGCVAAVRHTGEQPEPGHRSGLDPLEKSPGLRSDQPTRAGGDGEDAAHAVVEGDHQPEVRKRFAGNDPKAESNRGRGLPVVLVILWVEYGGV
jgi:hypothetical protein